MVFYWLTVAAAFLGAFTVAQHPPWGDELSDPDKFIPRRKEACNETFCLFEPCVGSAPPPICPSIIPECPTGCACYMECPNRVICFMTSHCTKIRRFLTKRRHARAISHDLQELHDFSESTVANALIGHVDRNLSSSTAVQAFGHADHTQPAPTVSDGIGEPDLQAFVDVQALSERVERDISRTTAAPLNENINKTLQNATVPANDHAAHDAVLLVQSNKDYEKAAEAAAEKAAEAAAEKAAKAAAEKAARGKAVSARSVKGVAVHYAAADLVFFTWFYSCVMYYL